MSNVVFPEAVYFGLLILLLAAAGVGAYLTFRRIRKKSRPLTLIGNNLAAIAAHIEEDLSLLQLEDCCGAVSEGWNRLIREVAEARNEIEAQQIGRHAQETLDRVESNWATDLLNRMPYGLLKISEDLEITFANATAERLLKVQSGALTGQKITDVFGESAGGIHPSRWATIDRTLDLQPPQVSIRLTAVQKRGDVQGAETAIFMRDVSQQKESERSREEFFYHVTHEFRTPLTNIRAYAETLSEGVLQDPDTVRECYNVIVGETQRLSRLVEDILNVSQLESGSARMENDDVQTARLIRQVVEDVQASADEKNIELILSMPPKVPNLRGDKDRLAAVLTNVIGNAIKYTPSEGRVEVSCAEDGARLQIKVSDTGIGIAPQDYPKVFEKFYRASDERVAKLPGTGLGLAIAKETVRVHGGTIELDSELGKGATFVVSLPLEKPAVVKT